jgi:predicted lipoprotein with Yx(FWY)xxD motif
MVRVAEVTGKGPILVDGGGWTLYESSRDGKGLTACLGSCATTWPPLGGLVCGCSIPGLQGAHIGPTAGVGVDQKALGSFLRPDGGNQATYVGSPLYRFSGDHAPGEANGDGVDGLWHVVRPTVAPPAP